MTDFEPKDLTGQEEGVAPSSQEKVPSSAPVEAAPSTPDAPASSAPEAASAAKPAEPVREPAQEPAPAAASPTPHLTLEPDPVPPEIHVPEEPHIPGSAAEPFHMPEPPRAPEPPRSEPTWQQTLYQQQTPPNYTAQQPQYQPTQYGMPQYGQPVQQAYYNVPPAGYAQKSRLAAGLLALLLGTFGVHNFYLGFNSRATIQLIVSLVGGIFTCGVATIGIAIWGFIEGILILSASSPARMYDGNGVILKD